MKINVELTDEERDALLFLLGSGTATAVQMQLFGIAKSGIRVLNKIFADSPDYTPYDENSLDSTSWMFPFKRVEKQ